MRSKILIISRNIAFPLSHGGAVAQFFFLEQLVNIYDVTYCTAVYNESEKQSLIELQNKIEKLKIIFSDEIVVERKLNLNEKIKSKIKKLYRFFFSKNDINRNVQKTILDSFFFNYASRDFILFLRDHFDKNRYDIIQCEFFETLHLQSILPKTSKKVFIHHELRYKLLSLIKTDDLEYKNYKVGLTKQLEKSLLNSFDAIVVFNDEDCQLLKKEKINPRLFISPFGISKKLIERRISSSFFSRFLFMGGESHHPNREGLIWLLDTIYIPNYTEIQWEINIVGNWSKETRQKYERFDKIIFLGFVDNLINIYENSVLVSPIVSGSGIRTKILQAFANKVPVMSTRFACEGLYGNDSVNHLLFFENESDFMSQYRCFYKNHEKLSTVAQEGFRFFSINFNEKKLIEKRIDVYEKIKNIFDA